MYYKIKLIYLKANKTILFQKSEAQIYLLRQQAKKQYETRVNNKHCLLNSADKEKHINFFSDFEDGKQYCRKDNILNKKEKKDEKLKYETKIGYLTYLGQDTLELKRETTWYNEIPKNQLKIKNEKSNKKGSCDDPIYKMNKFIKRLDKTNKGNETNVNLDLIRKRKLESNILYSKQKSDSGKRNSIEQLRGRRLLRERKEKLRTEIMLTRLHGNCKPVHKTENPNNCQKYNSQYFPEFARQNLKKNPK